MNPSTLMPVFLQRGAAWVVLAEAFFLIAVLAIMFTRAAGGSEHASRKRNSVPLIAAGFLAVWLGAAVVVADEAHFQIGEQWRRPWSALVAGLPFVFAVTVLFTSKSWIAFNRAIRPEWLIGVQLYRVAGGLFLFPFLAYGVVPAGFAWPAGVGDVLTGAFAPLVARMVAQRWRGAFGVAVIWNLFGILDLVVAPAAAILSRAPMIEIYPLSLVPLFLGPPLGILIHLHSLQNLFAHRGELGRTETWPRVA